MPDDLSTSIDKLRTSASRLNQITDQASQTVKEVEAFLNKECSVGIDACVRVKEECYQEGSSRLTYLEYRRVGPSFRIAVSWMDDGDPDTEDFKPWSDCGREEKLESVAKLPDLIKAVAKNLDDTIQAAENGVNAAKSVLAALKRKAGA